MENPEKALQFLKRQGFVIVSTLDANGGIHCSAKGILVLGKEEKVFIVDLYFNRTFKNLKRDPRISITAIDEHNFLGYTLQGKGVILSQKEMKSDVIDEWERSILKRMSKRVVKGVRSGIRSKGHFEASLPSRPKYFIEFIIENIIDLADSLPGDKPPKRANKSAK
ncbi:MAG: pyridoxamine 5'-phosphate oxidase family protein [Candidatus Omnitrophota bacterium]